MEKRNPCRSNEKFLAHSAMGLCRKSTHHRDLNSQYETFTLVLVVKMVKSVHIVDLVTVKVRKSFRSYACCTYVCFILRYCFRCTNGDDSNGASNVSATSSMS